MWKKISGKTIFTHPRITLLEDKVKLPNGLVVPYLIFKHDHDGATVICINDKNEVLLQREYSYPTGEVLYQFPGGKTEADESPENAARREIFEESGIRVEQISELGRYYTNNRRSAEMMYVFLVKRFSSEEKSGGDQEEDIASNWVPIDELKRMIKQGKIVNFSLLAAWCLFESRVGCQ